MFKDGVFYFASEMKAFFPLMDNIEPNMKLLREMDFFGWEKT